MKQCVEIEDFHFSKIIFSTEFGKNQYIFFKIGNFEKIIFDFA